MIRRDWSECHWKRDGGCRICGQHPVELAHIIGRNRDQRDGSVIRVDPDSVVGLCGHHHRTYDARLLDLLPYLTVTEQARAVLDAGGIEAARRRIIGRATAA